MQHSISIILLLVSGALTFAGERNIYFDSLIDLNPGDSLRAQLFDTLRPVHNKNLGTQTKTKFRGAMHAYKNWVIFIGDSVDASGNTMTDKRSELKNSDIVALWTSTMFGWKLVDYSFGHSDAFFTKWHDRYGVPRELL